MCKCTEFGGDVRTYEKNEIKSLMLFSYQCVIMGTLFFALSAV